MMPVIPGLIWLMAAACLLLLFIVIIGYHAYQRSRLKALMADAGDVGRLASQKERLEADIAAMRAWLESQQEQLQKFDADRRKQELLRIEQAQLERTLADRRKEADASLKLAASLEAGLIKKRNLIARLEAEIGDLEKKKSELEPMSQALAGIRTELEQGRAKLAAQAEQEIRTAALQRQAEELASGLAELKVVIEPLQAEKDRLRAWLDQARNAVAIRSERVREQNALLRELESACHDLKSRKAELEDRIQHLGQSHEQERERLRAEAADREMLAMRERKTELQAELERLGGEIQTGQATLMLLRQVSEQAKVRKTASHNKKKVRLARHAPCGRAMPRHVHPAAVYHSED